MIAAVAELGRPEEPSSASGWTDERVLELRRLWGLGWSGSMIAGALGLTRNAVIGKVSRMNLSAEGGVPRSRAAPKPKPKPKPKLKPPAPLMRPAVPVPDVAPLSLNVDIMALTSTACKWPVNDGNPYRFCGVGKPAEGGPYCAFHASVASGGIPGRRRPAA
jgi:GcrA cell cycle regulator